MAEFLYSGNCSKIKLSLSVLCSHASGPNAVRKLRESRQLSLYIIRLYINIGDTMEQFEAVPKKWGNSLGITIPADVAEEENIQPQKKITVLVIGNQQRQLKQMFGTLKLKKPTQQVMDEINEGYDEH